MTTATPEQPLSEAQLREIVEADRVRGKILFAAKVAAFNGWTLAGCAALCVPFVFFSPWSALIAVGLGLAAWAELSGRERLRALDPGGARVLAANQLALLLGVLVYCGVSLYQGVNAPPFSEQIAADPALSAMLEATGDASVLDAVGDVDALVRTLTLAVYGSVAVLSVLLLGGLFVFYRSRGRALAAYLEATPPWILELQRRRG